MIWLSRLFWLLLLLAAFVLALLTVNQQAVSLRFLDWQTPELSVFWWLLAAFGTGLVLGLGASLIMGARQALERRRLAKAIKVRDKEISTLKSVAQ